MFQVYRIQIFHVLKECSELVAAISIWIIKVRFVQEIQRKNTCCLFTVCWEERFTDDWTRVMCFFFGSRERRFSKGSAQDHVLICILFSILLSGA